MKDEKPELEILPWSKKGQFKPNTPLLDAVFELGVNIRSTCGGEGQCGKCKVLVKEGKENLSSMTEKEKKLLSKKEIESNTRLACRAKLEKDRVKIEIPEESQKVKQFVLASGKSIEYEKNPPIKDYPLNISPPTLEKPTPDFENVKNELERTYDFQIETIDYLTQQNLPRVLREGIESNEEIWEISAIVRDEEEIIDFAPIDNKNLYGLAVDLGTTTIVGYLMDLLTGEVVSAKSIENPQTRYGEDVISRITNILNEGEREKAHKVTVDGINKIIETVTKEEDISCEEIFEIVFVGNTAMYHLFLKIIPEFLSRSPYSPGRQASLDLKAREIGLDMNSSGYLHWIPINAGWVGADNVSVILTTEIYKKSEISLVIDIGTNGEIAVGNEDKAYVCSTAAGPALEGGQIKFGMRAAAGSIEKVKIDSDTLEPTFETIANVPAIGICGSGIVDTVAEFLKTGIIDKSGEFNKDFLSGERIKRNEQDVLEYVLVWKENTSLDTPITITQKDIREVQKAKGAMQAGARVLMDKIGAEQIDKVLLAGAFGNYIDKSSARRIGLFPDCDLDKVESIGNAAGVGAQMALASSDMRREAEKIPDIVKYYEIAGTEEFQDHYMDAMYFPHKDESLYSL